MTVVSGPSLPRMARAGAVLGLVALWSGLLWLLHRLGLADGLALALLCAVPPLLALLPDVARRIGAIPLLLPGLLIFFKQNDALAALAGGDSVNDALAALVALNLLFRTTRAQIVATLSGARLFFLLFAALFVALAVSSVNAVDLALSQKHAITFLKDIVFACLIAFSIRSPRDLNVMVNWLIAATSFSAAIMVLDTVTGAPLFPAEKIATWQGSIRSGGASTESVPDVATMVLMGTVLSGVLAIRRTRGRWLYAAAGLLGVAAILASISRGPFSTLVLAALLLLIRLRHEPFFPKAVSLAAVGVVILGLAMPQPILSKFMAVAVPSEDRTVARRLSYQEIGIDLFSSSPALGIGVGNYPVRYASNEFRFVGGRGTEARPLHNLYLQYATETGIVGAFLFLALVSTVAATLWRTGRAQDATLRDCSEGLLLAHVSVCILLLALSSKSFLGLWILIGLAIALARLCAPPAPQA